MGNIKQEHKHLIKWLEREREVSKQAKFKQEYTVTCDPDYKPKVYGMGIEIDKELAPNDWYIMEGDKIIVPAHLEKKAAELFNAGFTNWTGTYGMCDDPVEKDPVKDAINKAVRELG